LDAIANMAKASASSKCLWLAAVTGFLSLFAHGYLYLQHLALQSGEYTKSICDINEKFDCSAVSASKYAVMLNVPVALWGFMANAAFLILLVVLSLTDDEKKPAAQRNVWIAALGIFAGTVIMGSISMFLLSKFCLFCISAYVLSILMLVFTWLGIRGSQAFSNVRLGDFKALVITAVIAFIGAFVLNSAVTQGHDVNSVENQAEFSQFISDWQAAPAKSFKTVDPLVMGPENAKMTIIEFADFRCIHCKHAAPTVWCAQKTKQSGWAVHDYIYGLPEIYPSVDAVKSDLPALATAAGMSSEEMKTCADSDAAKAVVRSQAEVGISINLEGTPTIYVNQKLLSGGQALPVLQKAYGTL
jgi:uncharacterized membrane protein